MIFEPHTTDAGVRKGIDFAVIGSGSAGGVIAYHLAKAGFSVVVLEKGPYYHTEDLKHRELYMFSRLFSPTTFQPATGKHTRLAMLQGRCYGGSTISSDGVSWNLPRVIREDWEKMGLTSFSPANSRLDALQEEVRKGLEITRIEDGHHNRNNQLFAIACDRSGIEYTAVERNRSECMRCGYCAQGCRYGLKADMAQTYLQWAQKYGVDAYTGCEVKKIHVNYQDEDDLEVRRKIAGISEKDRSPYRRQLANRKAERGPYKFRLECGLSDRKTPRKRGQEIEEKPFTVLAHGVVLSAGTIASSRVLLRSGINPNQQVGKRFTAHPTTNVNGLHPGLIIDGFTGMNDTYEGTHFAYDNRDREYYDPDCHGFLLEAVYSMPWGIANLHPAHGKKLVRMMENFRYMQGIEVIVKSEAYGEISEDEVKYDIGERENNALVFGTKLAAKLMLKVGAKEIYTCLNDQTIRNKEDIDPVVDNEVRGRKVGCMTKSVVLHTGHAFGGNSMGKDPETSVVDETCEHHHIKRLFVCDGSVFPTAIGVNPHLSISVVGRKTVDHMVEKYGGQKDRSAETDLLGTTAT